MNYKTARFIQNSRGNCQSHSWRAFTAGFSRIARQSLYLLVRTWVIQKSEFQTVATETVRGLTGQSSNQASQPFYRNNKQRAFFGETAEEGR